MLITQILGNISAFDPAGRRLDFVPIAWWEVRKRIALLKSESGLEVAIKLASAPKHGLCDGDILYEDDALLLLVRILPSPALCVDLKKESALDLACVCYEIGNRHSPLFFTQTQSKITLKIPYEPPIAHLLDKMGIKYELREEILDGASRLQIPYQDGLQGGLSVKLSHDFSIHIKEAK